jgi:uncharacterized delta-60 repeat protein
VDGRVIGELFPGTTIHDAVALPDKRVVATGSNGQDFIIARYFDYGQPDPSFSMQGVTRLDFAGQIDAVNAVALAPDGKLLVAGSTGSSGPMSQTDFALVRYDPDGSLDASFGNRGKVTTDFGAYEIAYGIGYRPMARSWSGLRASQAA